MPLIERVRDREIEDAVAEQLEPFIRPLARTRPRGVRENDLRELARESVDQPSERGAVTGGW